MHASDRRSECPDVGALYATLREPLLAYIRKKLRDDEAAHDVLHDVFLRIHANAEMLSCVTRLDAWVYTITHNLIVDKLRHERPVTDLDRDLEGPPPADAELEAWHALSLTIPKCLEYLPEHYREALRLTALEGLSQRELAQRLGLSLSGAKSRVQRARMLLANLYRACCELEFDCRGTLVAFRPRENSWTCSSATKPCLPRR